MRVIAKSEESEEFKLSTVGGGLVLCLDPGVPADPDVPDVFSTLSVVLNLSSCFANLTCWGTLASFFLADCFGLGPGPGRIL